MTVPSGWRVPFEEDYKVMMKHMENSNFSVPGTALLQGGVTGFDVVFAGYYDTTTSPFSWNDGTNTFYLGTANYVDSNGRAFKIEKNGKVDYVQHIFNSHCIRLVKQ